MMRDGVLRIDKELGPTSHDVVDAVRRLLAMRRVGHAGTLDPLASGLLLVCVGRATKVAGLLADLDKVYLAQMRLGVATSTGDGEGEVTAEKPVPADPTAAFGRVVDRFIGPVRQIPPMASAIKVGGEPLHRLRRRGLEVERPARTVQVYSVEPLAIEPELMTLRIRCGKGTYVRTLIEDLGVAMGTCAHVAGLRRECIGPFTVDGAWASSRLAGSDPEAVVAQSGHSLREALMHLPAVVITDDAAYAVRHGVRPRWGDLRPVAKALAPGDLARLEDEKGELVAVVVATAALGDHRAGEPETAAPLRFARVLAGHEERGT